MGSEQIKSPVRYPSDLIDEEWEIIEAIISELDPYTTGRPRTTDLREIMNAIFYINKTGCPWRYLPKDFPSYKLVNYYVTVQTPPRNPALNNRNSLSFGCPAVSLGRGV
jgi:putative transposase